jgi:hypothetical protein
MLRWSGRVLLHSVFLLLANMVAIGLFRIAYVILVKAGALFPLHLFDTHILWRSLLVGLLAGALPVSFVLAGVGWLKPFQRNGQMASINRQPQFWTWIPYSCWLLYGISSWVTQNWNHSVLTLTRPPIAEAFRSFFTDPCGPTGTWTDLFACRYQVEFTAPWILSIGYSLATILVSLRSQATTLTQNDENSI